MADLKTHLRELSFATTVGLLKNNIPFRLDELYSSKQFYNYTVQVVKGDISKASNLCSVSTYESELKAIVNNGYALGKAVFENPYFKITPNSPIIWQGNDTQKEDPVDVSIDQYGFSLKENSFILENMGLYKLINCFTGSTYKRRHIFSDYARQEYETWFDVTWSEMRAFLASHHGEWHYTDLPKQKSISISQDSPSIKMTYHRYGKLLASATLPNTCSLSIFERKTSAKIREQVFARFIGQELKHCPAYNSAKKVCAVAATNALVEELSQNLNYDAGLARLLRFHAKEYYYAKTVAAGIEIYKVPSYKTFGSDILVKSIQSSVPDTQANILTTIENLKTGGTLTLRNECRFSHGQFNGTPEAKLYYSGSLETIYEKIP